MNLESDKPFQRDFDFVQRLIAGDPKAWDYFYNRVRPSIKIFLKRTFASFLDDVGREHICDTTQEELIANDYNILHGFRGFCSLQAYVNKRAGWRARDYLRSHGRAFVVDTSIQEQIPDQEADRLKFVSDENLLAFLLEQVPDELRWAFLVRYYCYLDFPESEIRKLSTARKWSQEETTRRLALADSANEDASVQKKLRRLELLQKRLERFSSKLRDMEEEWIRLQNSGLDTSHLDEEEESIRLRIASLQRELQSKRMLIATRYELISEILGEPNMNTLRSRVMQVLNLIYKRFLHGDDTSTKI